MMKIRSLCFRYWIPICLGIITFWLVSGFHFLNPLSLDTFHYSDNFTHHLSTVIFRNSLWTFPIGLNPNYGLINASTLIYADPVPLMAILLKIVTPAIPATFQYLGLWTLVSFIMQAFFAWKLLGLVTHDTPLKILGSSFFLFTPFLLIRVGMHAALVSQFLILAGLYLSFSKRNHYTTFYWTLLLGISASINFYLLFLVFVIWAANLVDCWLYKKSIGLSNIAYEIAVGSIITSLICWQLGYFVGKTSSITAGGFGYYQMNLLAPFDPQGWSYFIKKIATTPPYIEGFNYLGLGILLLIPIVFFKKATPSFSFELKLRQYRCLLLALFCLFMLALSNRVLIGNYLIEYSMPQPIFSLGGILRSSGRLFWPIGYLLIFLLVTLVIKKFDRKHAYWILSLTLAIQIIDTSAGWWPIRSSLNRPSMLGQEIQFSNPFWKSAAKNYKNVLSLIPQKLYDESWSWIPVAKYAAENKLGTNSAYLARIVPLENRPINNAANETNFNQGIFDTNSLYILSEQKILPALTHMDHTKDLLAKIDGVIAFAPNYKICKECNPVSSDLEIDQSILPISLGQRFTFGKPSPYGHLPYLLEGWAYPETWGAWSNSTKAAITLPLPDHSEVHELELIVRALITQNHSQQRVSIWVNGIPIKTTSLTKDNNNLLKIPINDHAIKEGYLIIGFTFPDAISPKKLDLGDDNRTLAIGLVSARYR